MRSGLFAALGVVLLSAAFAPKAAAQNFAPNAPSSSLAAPTHVLTISGIVTADRKTLLSETGVLWNITNPSALVGYSGYQVEVKARGESGKARIRVLQVKMEEVFTSSAKLGDAAFRR